ncbi:MAG: hypothetical protein WC451_04835 [Patescibacteria group bacterium]
MPIQICLLGSIPKGDETRKNWVDWKIKYKEVLGAISGVSFVDGDAWREESKPELTFGHDVYQIKQSDIIIVNAENKLGAGTAQEMVIAKYLKKPVISVLPKNSHHRRSDVVFDGETIKDWIHPFILAFSDAIVENISESLDWVSKFANHPTKVKGIEVIDDAIGLFEKYLEQK